MHCVAHRGNRLKTKTGLLEAGVLKYVGIRIRNKNGFPHSFVHVDFSKNPTEPLFFKCWIIIAWSCQRAHRSGLTAPETPRHRRSDLAVRIVPGQAQCPREQWPYFGCPGCAGSGRRHSFSPVAAWVNCSWCWPPESARRCFKKLTGTPPKHGVWQRFRSSVKPNSPLKNARFLTGC